LSRWTSGSFFEIITLMRINTRKIKAFTYKHRLIIAVVAFVVIAGAATGYFLYGALKDKRVDTSVPVTKQEEKSETPVKAPLTGLATDEEKAKRRPLGVVIENSPEARPQSGLLEADVVYETVAEGGITRMLAIYQSKDSSEMGPVRSARFYFIDWLSELSAVFVHVGGNIMALDEIAAKKIPDINQFYWSGYFWRDSARYAPHNVYTTTAKLYAAIKKAGYDKSFELRKLNFKEEPALEQRGVAQNISIPFSTPLFTVGYAYDRTNNDYVRSLAGVLHKDKRTGQAIRAKNIIVQFESITNIKSRDGVTTGKIGTIGTGKAIIFQDGKATVGSWKKDSRNSQTVISDSTGVEIKLNPGQTWFEVVPLTAKVTY
jgi:hypothetical protein